MTALPASILTSETLQEVSRQFPVLAASILVFGLTIWYIIRDHRNTLDTITKSNKDATELFKSQLDLIKSVYDASSAARERDFDRVTAVNAQQIEHLREENTKLRAQVERLLKDLKKPS